MTVDVLYEGLPVAQGATAREEGPGAFIELDAPMPVGARLVVRGPTGDRPARVVRVHEGIGPGVVVSFLDGQSLGDAGSQRTAAQVPQATQLPAEPEAAETEPEKPDDKPESGNEKKSRRKKRRG